MRKDRTFGERRLWSSDKLLFRSVYSYKFEKMELVRLGIRLGNRNSTFVVLVFLAVLDEG